MVKGTYIMAIISLNSARSSMSGRATANGDRTREAAQVAEVKGLRALNGATYVSVSDGAGRMDDDLFDLLLEEEEAPIQPKSATQV